MYSQPVLYLSSTIPSSSHTQELHQEQSPFTAWRSTDYTEGPKRLVPSSGSTIPIISTLPAILPNPAPRALTMTLISPLSQFLHPLAIPVSPLRPPKPGRSNSVSPLLRLCTPSTNYSWHSGTPEPSPMCSKSTFFRRERWAHWHAGALKLSPMCSYTPDCTLQREEP